MDEDETKRNGRQIFGDVSKRSSVVSMNQNLIKEWFWGWRCADQRSTGNNMLRTHLISTN
jgi:hypothetical protein